MYFVEKAPSACGKVIYDRANSAISLAKREDFDWNAILDGADWFHWTGITPALGGELPEIVLDALKKCREKGVTVSCDLNYRSKLWTREKAGEVMSRLVPYVNVCIANEEDAADVFGIHAADTDVSTGKLNKEGYVSVAKQICKRFGCKKVAITLRGSISANDNNWAGMLFDGEKACFSKNYLIHIVDRVGGGDSFGGGLIHALLKEWQPQQVIEFAVAASCLSRPLSMTSTCVRSGSIVPCRRHARTGSEVKTVASLSWLQNVSPAMGDKGFFDMLQSGMTKRAASGDLIAQYG